MSAGPKGLTLEDYSALQGLTVKEAAERLNVSRQQVYSEAKRHGLQYRGHCPRGPKRKPFPEMRDQQCRDMRAAGIAEDGIFQSAMDSGQRAGAIEKARRMDGHGHPPGVIAQYTGLTKGEVCVLLGRGDD